MVSSVLSVELANKSRRLFVQLHEDWGSEHPSTNINMQVAQEKLGCASLCTQTVLHTARYSISSHCIWLEGVHCTLHDTLIFSHCIWL